MSYDLAKVFEHYEVDAPRLTGEQSIRCPLEEHQDRNKSCQANFSKNVWNCHGCCRGGGVLDFIEAMEGVTRAAARQRATEILGADLSAVPRSSESRSSLLPQWARNRYGGGGKIPPGNGRRPSSGAP